MHKALAPLQQCGGCSRPFAPQSVEGRVACHWHCGTCNERLCSFCHGQPGDWQLMLALQRLSMGKMMHCRLCEASPCEDLDLDVILEHLSPLVQNGAWQPGE